MANVLQGQRTHFSPEIVNGIINQVTGESILAKLTNRRPVAFNGTQEMTFNMDGEIEVVGENAQKNSGEFKLATRTINPIKVQWSGRVTEEILYASEERQIDLLKEFTDGFGKKVARGFDLMAFHGVNPYDQTDSDVIGTNNFDDLVTQTVVLTDDPDATLQAATNLVDGSGGDINGFAFSKVFNSALADYKVNGVKQFPEFSYSGAPASLSGITLASGKNVSDMADNTALAYVGDFENAFRWGYASDVMVRTYTSGNPDGHTDGDLGRRNQVLLRAELYIGWAILEPNSFAIITETATTGE